MRQNGSFAMTRKFRFRHVYFSNLLGYNTFSVCHFHHWLDFNFFVLTCWEETTWWFCSETYLKTHHHSYLSNHLLGRRLQTSSSSPVKRKRNGDSSVRSILKLIIIRPWLNHFKAIVGWIDLTRNNLRISDNATKSDILFSPRGTVMLPLPFISCSDCDNPIAVLIRQRSSR